tara:strand:- start:4860 stop:5021 length:162 start_codon:yes stop_codon:yes gene_type:complete
VSTEVGEVQRPVELLVIFLSLFTGVSPDHQQVKPVREVELPRRDDTLELLVHK